MRLRGARLSCFEAACGEDGSWELGAGSTVSLYSKIYIAKELGVKSFDVVGKS